MCVACGSLKNIIASGLRDYTQWGQEQRRAGSSKGAGFGDDSKGQPCGLGACEVRTCLWGNVWVRVSVAGGRIQVSPSLTTSLWSQLLPVAALPGGDTPRCG